MQERLSFPPAAYKLPAPAPMSEPRASVSTFLTQLMCLVSPWRSHCPLYPSPLCACDANSALVLHTEDEGTFPHSPVPAGLVCDAAASNILWHVPSCPFISPVPLQNTG